MVLIMSILSEEIMKRLKLAESELVNEAENEVTRITNNQTSKKVNGIVQYYKKNKKLTEGQRESLIRTLASLKTFTE